MKYFIECTHTYHTKMNSGIQRVVRNIVRSSGNMGIGHDVVPVIFENGDFFAIDKEIPYPIPTQVTVAADPFTKKFVAWGKKTLKDSYRIFRGSLRRLIPYDPFVAFLYAPRTQWGLSRMLLVPHHLVKKATAPAPAPERRGIEVEKGDVLVLLDSSWHINLWKAVDKHKANGARVVVIIYDLIPHSWPQFCVPALVQSFNDWMKDAAQRIDAVVAISETIAHEFRREWPKIAGPAYPSPAISYFWLGSELDGERHENDRPISEDVLKLGASPRPTYVYVSTIEPRKNHMYALDAFELLWQRGVEANFVIIGRIGWKCEELVQRVRNHEQFGKQLFMLNNVEDNELAHLYDRVQGLIFTSVTEGFGLPIVEGLQRGLPVFASDIPVFREIGKQGVRFVDLSHPDSLADSLANHIREGAGRLEAPIAWLSWQESTEQFYERIGDCLAAIDNCPMDNLAQA